jgi:c-di-GMP phosphodiesterase Gmr
MVRGIVPLAEALDVKLVAEGVETVEDHEWLRDIGINYQQGFHFTRPAPADQLGDWLLAASP